MVIVDEGEIERRQRKKIKIVGGVGG